LDVLLANGVDVNLNGHEHNYERRAVTGAPASTTAFIVGTAGAVLRPFTRPADAETQARLDDVYGVPRLELSACGYAWQLL
jgi:hypothetical protein